MTRAPLEREARRGFTVRLPGERLVGRLSKTKIRFRIAKTVTVNPLPLLPRNLVALEGPPTARSFGAQTLT